MLGRDGYQQLNSDADKSNENGDSSLKHADFARSFFSFLFHFLSVHIIDYLNSL